MLRTGVMGMGCLMLLLCVEARAETSPLARNAAAAGAATGVATAAPAEGPAAAAVAAVTTPNAEGVDVDDPADDNLSSPNSAVTGKAPAAEPPPLPEPTLIVSINLSEQSMSVSEGGAVRYTWPISSGTVRHQTPTGVFRPEWTSKMWYSRKYDWAPMPHAVFINGGVAVHATYHVSALGSPASHGCIRLSPTNAKTFYNLVQSHGLKKVKVTVFGKPDFRGEPAVASRSATRKPSVASNEYDSWFWGSSSRPKPPVGSSSARRMRPVEGQTYYYADGSPAKVYRKRNGELTFAPRDKRRRSAKAYGYNY